jgi:O-antigen/teichoic acid export membrane protein
MTAAAPSTARQGGPPSASGPAAGTATRESARSGVIGLVGAAASGLFGFLLAVVITRGYGTVGSGAFFAAIGVVTVAAAVCTLGAETGLMWALPRRRAGAGGDAARVLPVALVPPLVASVAVAVAGFLGADRLAPRLLASSGADGVTLLRVTFAAVPVVVCAMLFLAALRCLRPIGSYVAVQFFLLPIGRPALVGLVALVSGGLALGMAGWLVPAAVALLVCGVLVAGPLGVDRGAALTPHRADWRSFWGFALPRAASAAIDAGSMWVGVLLTAALASQADAGVFGAVGRYVLAGQLAMQGLRVATSPQLSRLLGQGRREEAAQVHRQLTTWGIVLSWPVYLLLAVFGLAFLRLFGPEFTAGTTAMTVLAVAMLVNIAVGNVQSLLLMGGRSGLHLMASLTGLLVNVTLSLLLVGRYGVLGAAVAWGVGIATENIGAALAARRVIGHRLTNTAMLRAAVLVVVGVGAASAVGVGVGGRGVVGLVTTLVVLSVGCAGLVAVPAVRRALRRIIGQISGRGATPVAPDGVAVRGTARRMGG